MANDNKVNCLKCKHYTVTWNPKFPNACKLLGFKSASMPSAVAYESTGKICECFERKGTQRANSSSGSGSGSDNADLGTDAQAVIVSIGNKEKHR